MAGGFAPKDTTLTKLFVGGLPYHTTDETLKAHFDQYGEIEEAVVITDRVTNKSKGYGFVTMVDKEHAEKAIKDPNPVIDGRKANVNLAYLGAKPRGVQALNAAAFLKPGLINPQFAQMQQLYAMGLIPSPAAAPLGQMPTLPLLSQPPSAQISQAAAQYATLADYSNYAGYPTAGLTGLEFQATSPTAVTNANYGALSPQLAMSFPQTAATLAGLQQFQQLQSGDARLQ